MSNSKPFSFTNKLDFSQIIEFFWNATPAKPLSKDHLNNGIDYNNGKKYWVLWFWALYSKDHMTVFLNITVRVEKTLKRSVECKNITKLCTIIGLLSRTLSKDREKIEGGRLYIYFL